MKHLIIAVVSLSVGLAGSPGVALAQKDTSPVVMTNTTGTCVTTGSPGNWTISCGDLTPGSGITVIAPPAAEPLPAADVAPAPAPAPVAETTAAPVSEMAVATESDLDADNYADALESDLGLDPANADTDADGVADGDELNLYSTDPTIADTDGDGALDGEELFGSHTDPLLWNDASLAASQPAAGAKEALAQETIEDLTASNGNAAALGKGDASASPGTVTRDGVSGVSLLGPDGTYSVKEVSPPVVNVSGSTAPAPVVEAAPVAEPVVTETTAEPVAADTAIATETDLDADNYADALEWDLGLDPNNADTDADGVADGDELSIYGTNATVADSDGDGILDGEELFGIQSDPLVWEDHFAAGTGEAVLS